MTHTSTIRRAASNTTRALSCAPTAHSSRRLGIQLLTCPILTRWPAHQTRLQSLPGATFKDVPRWWATLGPRGLYCGILPALSGAFLGHGLRTGGYEAALRALEAMGGAAVGLQVRRAAGVLGGG